MGRRCTHRGRRTRWLVLAWCATLGMATGCDRSDHPDPMYGWMLENDYPDGVPPEQREALADQVITREELEAAAAAEVACVADLDGVIGVDGYNWQNEIDLVGGGPRFAAGVDEAALGPAIEACYYQHLALVFTAWLDQEHFGGWTEDNLLD